jgi:hypothetical protein
MDGIQKSCYSKNSKGDFVPTMFFLGSTNKMAKNGGKQAAAHFPLKFSYRINRISRFTERHAMHLAAVFKLDGAMKYQAHFMLYASEAIQHDF